MSGLNGRTKRLEERLGRRPKAKGPDAAVLLYEPGQPDGPFTSGEGERFENLDAAKERFRVIVTMPRNGREAPPGSY